MPAVELGKLRSLPFLLGIATNPLVTLRRLHDQHDRFVLLRRPNSRRSRPLVLPCVADAELYKSITSNSEAWRTGAVIMPTVRNSAINRLTLSMTRLQGARQRTLPPPDDAAIELALRLGHGTQHGDDCRKTGRVLAAG